MSEPGAGYQRILVPVDFSPASAHSLRYALALGDAFASTVDAFHVWRTNTETPVNVARERAKEELRSFTQSMGPRGGATLRRRTDYGDPYLTILRVAQLSSYDLLLVAAPRTGDGGPEHLGLALMHGARLPVLLVPGTWVEGRKEPELKRHVQKILLPAAFAGRSPVAAERTLALAQRFEAAVEVLFAAGAELEAEQARFGHELTQNVAWQAHAERHEIDLPLERALEQRAAEGGYDLLVLAGPRGAMDQHSADPLLGRLLLGQRCPTLCERWD